MSAILGALLAEFWPYIAGAGLIIAGFFGVRRSAVKDERAKAEARAAKAAIKTRKDMDDAIENSRASGAEWHDRLSQLQPGPKRKR